jgi:nitrous oxidase accessory protein NosD
MRHALIRPALLGVAAAAAVPVFASAASAAPATASGPAAGASGPGVTTVYVAPSGQAGAAGHSCATAAYASIQAAVTAVPARGTVIVCPGTYHESVTITKALRLAGRPGATIDATGQPYGVGAAASYVTISGLTVRGATVGGLLADGIVTAGLVNGTMIPADHIVITGDTTEANAGSGIDLNSTSHSVAAGNRSTGNSVGINVSDDFNRTAADNVISGNVTNDNPGGCGIALADHTGDGIARNLVAGNVSNDNGLGTPSAAAASAGSGVILAGATGGVFGNTVTGNVFDGNGHAGFDVHAHAPGMNLSGNVVTGNRIGVNNLRTSEGDSQTTGVYLGDASPLAITVEGNTISADYYGIFTAGGPVTVRGAQHNRFQRVTSPFGSSPTFS